MAALKESNVLKVKPGQGRRQLGAPRVVVAASLPRTIRNRSPRRKLVKPAATSSPRAMLHEEMANPLTGKVAMGPWQGPFAAVAASAPDALIPSTIYMDTRGSCHLDLDPLGDARLSQQLLKAQSDSGLLSEVVDEAAAAAAAAAALVRREVHAGLRSARAHSSACEHAARDHRASPPVKQMMRRTHAINQPRRFN